MFGSRPVFLAGLEDAKIHDILARSDLRAYTPKTVFDPEKIWRRISETRQRGFAIAEEQVYTNDIALAAPIYLPDGYTTAAAVLAASIFATMKTRSFGNLCR